MSEIAEEKGVNNININKHKAVHLNLQKDHSGKSTFFKLSSESKLRALCITITKSKLFSLLIIITITVNCIILGLNASLDASWSSALKDEDLYYTIEIVCQIIYTIEMIIKIIASGFLYNGNNSYLCDNWNRLDFFLVIVGYLVFIPAHKLEASGDIAVFNALKALRVLRPLRTLNMIPALKY